MTPRKNQTANIKHFPNFIRERAISTTTTLIVVPCYNEEKRLKVNSFRSFLKDNADVSFVFVNDGSTDATLARLIELRDTTQERITVINLPENQGKAEAVRQGLMFASGTDADFVGYWDADLATPLDAIQDFNRIMRKFRETAVVYGARRILLGHRINRTMSRRVVSRVCAVLARQAIGLPIGDTQCGAKLLRNTQELREVISMPFTAGWLFDVELFSRISAKIKNQRYAFYEQPLAEWEEVAGSNISLQTILKSGFRMLTLIAQTRLGINNPKSIAQAVHTDDQFAIAQHPPLSDVA